MIYFDHAATSFPKPPCVLEEVERCLSECGNPGRSGHVLARKSEERIYRCREELCGMVGSEHPENVVFCKNATESLNMALAVCTPRGCHVLISDMDHNATLRPVYRLAKDRIISGFDIFSTSGDVEEELNRKKRKNTGMLVCTHASNVTGKVLPIERIAGWCARNGVELIVDGSQALGHIRVDIGRGPVCAYCGTSHKALLGIQGCGFAVFGTDVVKRSFLCGGTGSMSLEADMPDMLPDRLEAGTLPTPAIASMSAGISFLRAHGTVNEQMRRLTGYCHDRLEQIRGVRLYSDRENPCGIVSFLLEGEDSERTAESLAENGVCCRGGLHCAALAHRTLKTTDTGLVRCSLGYGNTMEEVDRMCDMVAAIKNASGRHESR